VAAIWTCFVVVTIALPPLIPAIAGIVPRRASISLRNHFRLLRRDFELGLLQSAFLITFLAHQAWVMTDAIGRTLYRISIGRRHLLEWVTAAQSSDDSQFDSRGLAAQIAAGSFFAACIGIALYFSGQHTWPVAAPFAALWVLSPIAARWASLPPPVAGHIAITPDHAGALRLVARRTWRFFETFITAEDNMLPPDNFQEDPKPVIAHRTSPTNIGLYLLSVVAARDFGWLGTLDMLGRLEATLATMDRMERFRGHFFNWYETRDLHPLEPRYISSVDSGNLAGHLIALANACRTMADEPIVNPDWAAGLDDGLSLVREFARATRDAAKAGFDTVIRPVADGIHQQSSTPSEIARRFAGIAQASVTLDEFARGRLDAQSEAGDSEIAIWTESLRTCIATHLNDVDSLASWAKLIAQNAPPADVMHVLDVIPSLDALPLQCDAALKALSPYLEAGESRFQDLAAALEDSAKAGRTLLRRLAAIADHALRLFNAMEFGFLFDSNRQLLSIGYRAADGSLDPNYYDLLASEARLASFIAIAKGDVPATHWFHLGRTLTPIHRGSGLISWSGSMFEYLMPSLVMRAPSGSLLEQTNRLIVRRQIEYGAELGVPWGMSESEYNLRDIEQTYQYSSFGVPDLAYKRGLANNTVIAPYASGLACMVAPAAAAQNYARMSALGVRGAYGWYEAIDYTRDRLPEGAKFAIVRAYMAHHHAMTIVGIANALHDGRMRARFHSEPIIQATELLLQERMPRD
ncbi:MAG: glycosyl transferase, partial [Planctomycetia bacterium]|nr:glycosyl transferase [Planctomycetia bacterium]